MATTINYVIRKQARKDGTFAVNIRVIHQRQQRRLPTSIYLKRSQLSKDLSYIKDTRAEKIVDERVNELRDRFLEINHPEYYGIDQLIRELTRPTTEAFRLDFFAFGESKMASMEPKTAEGYRTSLNAVERFIGCRHLDINEITSSWVWSFREFLETEKPVRGMYAKKSKGSRAVSYYLGCLRHLHNLARMTYNDEDTGRLYIPRQPFTKGVIPSQPLTEHRVLTIAQIRAVMNADTKPGTRAELGRDMFMLSFALAGTNTIDLFGLKKSDLVGDLVTYNREKTDSTRRDHAKITLKVLPMAANIIAKYGSDTEMLLNVSERYANPHEFNRAINIGLKDVARIAGLDGIPLSSYYARHSWATIARNVCHVDFDTVNAALNHVHQGSDRIGDIYIARDYSAIWATQAAVMNELLTENSGILPISEAV